MGLGIHGTVPPAARYRFDAIRVTEEMPLTDGGSFTWVYTDPCGALEQLVQQAPAVTSAYLQAKRKSPPSVHHPWHLVVAWDEFCPGNKLQVDPARKVMVMSFTFLELGQDVIASGLGWITPLVVRTSVIRQVQHQCGNGGRLPLT